MHDYVLSCCSTADLDKSWFEKRNLHYICFHFRVNGEQYPDDLGESYPFPAFYQAMRDGAETGTSQVNQHEFTAYFSEFLEKGLDIVHVSLSSGLSGVNNSAKLAKEELKALYPDRKIYLIDSLGASSGYGLMMDKLCDLRDEGASAKDLVAWADENRLKINHLFFSTDLSYYVKGGRISRASAIVGNMLHICPLLDMDAEGRLRPLEKVRTKKKVIVRIVEKMKEQAQNGLNYAGKCFISHSDCMEDASKVAELVEANFPRLRGKVQIFNVGTTIGSHTGPGTVALFFIGSPRLNSVQA